MKLGVEKSRDLTLIEKEFDGFGVLKSAYVANGAWYLVHKGGGSCWACESRDSIRPRTVFKVPLEELTRET